MTSRSGFKAAKEERAWWLKAGAPIGLTQLYGWNLKSQATFIEDGRMVDMEGRVAAGIHDLAEKLAIAEGRKP